MPHRPRTPVSPTAGRPATRTSEPCLGQIVAYIYVCDRVFPYLHTIHTDRGAAEHTGAAAPRHLAARYHVESSRPEASANSPSSFDTPRQRRSMLRAASSLGQPRSASASLGQYWQLCSGWPTTPAMLPTQVRQAAGHRGPPRLLRLRRAAAALPPRTGSLPHADEAGGRAAIAHCGMARHRGLHPNPNLNPNPSPSPNPDPNPNR